MAYQVRIIRSAEKELDAVAEPARKRLIARIVGLGEEPRPNGSTKLKGSTDEYRVRAGDYRVLYLVDDKARTVTVMAVGHRRDVYR